MRLACALLRRLLPLGALLLPLLWALPARAYPQFVFKGYGDCSACHHSPTGGGLPNRWGIDSLSPTFASSSDWANQDLSDPTVRGLKIDLGLDVRVMALVSADGDATGPAFIPMLTEVGGAVALGRWLLYGTVTARRLYGSGTLLGAFSREHWLKLQLGQGLDLRIGRMVLPFGIRQPDHTQYTREDFDGDKYDQSYGIEVDYRSDGWALSGNVFAGDLTGQPTERQDRGVVLTPSVQLGSDANIGVSLLGATSSARTRVAGSVFGRTALGASLYLLAEVAAQRWAAREGDAELSTWAEYLRLGWFAGPALDVYVEAGHRVLQDVAGSSKARVGAGVNWQLFHWLELAPQLQVERRAGLPARFAGMAQLHFLY